MRCPSGGNETDASDTDKLSRPERGKESRRQKINEPTYRERRTPSAPSLSTASGTWIKILAFCYGCLVLFIALIMFPPMILHMDATSRIANLELALGHYIAEMGHYPSDQNRRRQSYLVDKESIINLVETLDGDGVQPKYQVKLWDEDDDSGYRYLQFPKNDLDEDGAYLDPWGNPFYYRENASKHYSLRHFYLNKYRVIINYTSYDIWSAGPDGKTNLEDPDAPENEDDIGNW